MVCVLDIVRKQVKFNKYVQSSNCQYGSECHVDALTENDTETNQARSNGDQCEWNADKETDDDISFLLIDMMNNGHQIYQGK